MSEDRTNADFCREVTALIETWCDRRELNALREILSAWPIAAGLTDDWHGLASALRSIAGMRNLPEVERDAAKRLFVEIEAMLANR